MQLLQSPADWEASRDLAAVIVPFKTAAGGLSPSSAERSIFCHENVRGSVTSGDNNERRRDAAIDSSHFWPASSGTLSWARVQSQVFCLVTVPDAAVTKCMRGRPPIDLA